ncbi:MAG: iron ABC transporter permease [Bacteroidales bacterium]|nr:iron ABC transporter permease [Bacteroidales bacterium]
MKTKISILSIILVVLAVACVATGSTELSLWDMENDEIARKIILEYRVPQCITAILAGMSLSVAGLLLQTTFRNPLAGPSILGISTGASLGVAVATMAMGGASAAWIATASISGSMIGAFGILALIMALSAILRSNTMLLIAGIMISYFASSAISLLNFFAPSQSVKNFTVWGMGSFSNVQGTQLSVMTVFCILGLLSAFMLMKPLNAMLLGDNYAESLGINVRRSRNLILLATGILTAIVTTYCGPISFIGLAVPHIARFVSKTSDHRKLLPVCILCGGITALCCCIISSSFPSIGILPINALTPIFGAPVIIYVILRRGK